MQEKQQKPFLERICRILFILGAVDVAAVVLVDIVSYIRYDASQGFLHLLENVSTSGLFMSAVCAAAVTAACLIAIRSAEKEYYLRIGTTAEAQNREERGMSRRAIGKLTARFRTYIKISLAVTAGFLLLRAAVLLVRAVTG